MPKKRRKFRLKRQLAVFKRRIKRLTRKKVILWLKRNLRQHPFVLGLLFFAWIDSVFRKGLFTGGHILGTCLFHLMLFFSWLILVILSNLLYDKQRVKWYLRKRFVLFTLLLIPLVPLGIIFLWSGSKFKKATKIIFTLVFGGLFIFSNIEYNKNYDKLLKKTSLEVIVEMVTKEKNKVFLKVIPADILEGLEFSTIPKDRKAKLAISEIAARCSSAVVSIKTTDKDGEDIGQGSGFIISEDGVIITNFHVLESAYKAEVQVGEAYFKDVYLIKGFPELDIALIKIDSESLPVLPIGDSDGLVNGELVVVLGNPLGLERSISNGLISAVRTKGKIKLIQMTAPVSLGSSGGPVINEYGEVVGITTIASFFMVQNLNFAIPINYLGKVIKEKK